MRLLYLSLALACGTRAAQPGDTPPSTEPPREPAAVERSEEAKKTTPAPHPFVPTEKIKADSAISFPVDI